MNSIDKTYLSLVQDVLDNGILKPTRAKVNGINIGAYSVFGRQSVFNFAEGFPILTTKRVAFKTLAHELIWFLRGESNIKYLQDNHVKIWDAWADKNGDLGFGTYGTLWRDFPNHREEIIKNEVHTGLFKEITVCHDEPVDQIKELIDNIKKVKKDPTASCGRRLIVTAWHPYYIDKVGLPPCHVLFQLNVTGERLSLQLYQRSCDAFLGVPFNISSYCLLLSIIAHLTNLIPHEFVHTYGDLHIYENHVEQMKEQLIRSGHPLPKLKINPDLRDIDNISINDFTLENYRHDGVLKGEVAI